MSSPTLQEIYASAPPDVVLVKTLEVDVDGIDNLYLCEGFEDIDAALEDSTDVTFKAGNLAIGRPKRSDKTKQNLTFGVWNANGEINKLTRQAESSGVETLVYYREYVLNDLSTPIAGPLVATVHSISIQDASAKIIASYRDILNTQYPRERFTDKNAPGVLYL